MLSGLSSHLKKMGIFYHSSRVTMRTKTACLSSPLWLLGFSKCKGLSECPRRRARLPKANWFPVSPREQRLARVLGTCCWSTQRLILPGEPATTSPFPGPSQEVSETILYPHPTPTPGQSPTVTTGSMALGFFCAWKVSRSWSSCL